jgi:hypothetical protein
MNRPPCGSEDSLVLLRHSMGGVTASLVVELMGWLMSLAVPVRRLQDEISDPCW